MHLLSAALTQIKFIFLNQGDQVLGFFWFLFLIVCTGSSCGLSVIGIEWRLLSSCGAVASLVAEHGL